VEDGIVGSAIRLHNQNLPKRRIDLLEEERKNPALHPCAERFVDHVELARATMAPPFFATALDGQHISMDSLAG
jgi:hypothetical protein